MTDQDIQKPLEAAVQKTNCSNDGTPLQEVPGKNGKDAPQESSGQPEEKGNLTINISAVFIALGLILGLLTIGLSLLWRNATPALAGDFQAPKMRAEEMMAALAEGDYGSVEACLYGTPALGMDAQVQSALGAQLLECYRQSIRYEIPGQCYARQSGVGLDIQVTALDTQTLTQVLADRAPQLLQKAAEQAEDKNRIMDEEGQYTEEFVTRVLCREMSAIAAEPGMTSVHSITLLLTFEDGCWWILPEKPLLNVISGTT